MGKKAADENMPAVLGQFAIANVDMNAHAQLMAENLAGESMGIGDLGRFKFPTGGSTIFTSVDGSVSERVLSGVIIYHHAHRAYWEKSLEEGGVGIPDCASRDGNTGIPNAASQAADKGQGGECKVCPLAQFDSGKDGRQACKLSRRIFLLRQDNMLPEIVNLPPTSLKEWRGYMTRLTTAGIPYHRVITEVSLVQDKSKNNVPFAKAQLRMVVKLDGADVETVERFRAGLLPYLKQMDVDYAKDASDGE